MLAVLGRLKSDNCLSSDLGMLLENPNKKLARPLAWVGIYDKSKRPRYLSAGSEHLVTPWTNSRSQQRVLRGVG